MTNLAQLKEEIARLASPEQAKRSLVFFKTGPGEYAEGDAFLGITVPKLRKLARKADRLSLDDTILLLQSPWHEERFLGVLILMFRYTRGSKSERSHILTMYINELGKGINNWDLVDVSAAHILGNAELGTDRRLIYALAREENLWKKRAALIATHAFIHLNDLTDSLILCEVFIRDPRDLMRKACGWTLREVGKRDIKLLKAFLRKHFYHLPRVTLRYAIERMSKDERASYMSRPRVRRVRQKPTDDNDIFAKFPAYIQAPHHISSPPARRTRNTSGKKGSTHEDIAL